MTEHRPKLAYQQPRGHCLLACMPVAAGSSPRCMMVDASDRGWTRGMQMHSGGGRQGLAAGESVVQASDRRQGQIWAPKKL